MSIASDSTNLTPPSASASASAAADWIEAVPLPALVLSPQGHALAANAALLRWAGRTLPDLLGLGWQALWPADGAALLGDALARGRAFSLSTRLARADGQSARVDLRAGELPGGAGWLCVFVDTEAAHEREEVAQAATERLALLADEVPVSMAYYSREGGREDGREGGREGAGEGLVCRYANRRYARTWGREPQDLIGRSLPEIVGADAARQILPHVQRLLAEGQPVSYERTLERAGEPACWLDVHLLPDRAPAAPAVRGLFVLISDISRFRRAEHEVRRSEERLAKFLQASAEGIVFHQQGLVTDANPPLLQWLGYDLDEVVGRPVRDFIAPEHRERAQALATRGQDEVHDSVLLRKDGSRLPVEFSGRSIEFQGEWLSMTVVRDLRDRLAAQARIHFLAHHDALTGLPNRGTFLEQAEQAFARARQEQLRVALLFVDIDHFKRVNDSLGHLAGDAMLKAVAARITGALRMTDLVGRFAGDEFVVLLAGNPEREAIEEVARKLLVAVELPMQLGGPSISVTPSIGIAVFPEHSADPAELLKQADTAMYHAKSRGRARYLFFEPAMATEAYDALVLESDLAQALREGQFELAYQPQVRAGDGALVGMEALVRWRHPQRGWVNPDEFIPLAEKRRLMLGIGHWVLSEALRQATCWRAAGLLDVRVGVNLSAMQFQGAGFVQMIERVLADNGAAPQALELELTERMIMDDLPDGQASLQALRQLGVHVALDDFGTGTTSLSQLKTLKVDRLKIDRSFVQDLPHDAASAAVAEAIIRLAIGLHLDVVAEGVENAEQWAWLAARGCPQVQGHHVALPMNAADFERWLLARRAPV